MQAAAAAAAAAAAPRPQVSERTRIKHIISQVALHIVRRLTGADFESACPGAIDSSLKELIEEHVPVRVPARPAHGARLLDDRADMRLWRLVAVLKACLDVLDRSAGSTTTKREIYYSDVDLFGKKQSVANRAIEQAVTMLANIDGSFGSFARQNLGIVAAKRGMCYGQVIYKAPNGNKYNCAQGTGWSIEPSVHGGKLFLLQGVDRILVVEKETVFHRLAQAADDEAAPGWLKRTVLVTGKGYPDVATRTFLRALLDPASYEPTSPKPANLKVYGLVDGDPHGLDILSVYINGSGAMRYAGQALRVPEILWVGVRHADIARLSVPDHALLPFGARDRSVTTRLLADPARLNAVHAGAADHLRALALSGKKAEIECLHETEGGLLCYLEQAMAAAAAEPARPVYDPAAAASSSGGGSGSGSETEDEADGSGGGAAATSAAAAARRDIGDDFDFTSDEDSADSDGEDDGGGAVLCTQCGKWSDAQRMRAESADRGGAPVCYACWRRQYDCDDDDEDEGDRAETEAEDDDGFESD
jgi:meiotic recombination protein SPO11